MENSQSHFISPSPTHELHVKEFPASENKDTIKKTPVLFIHGAIENGKIFYSQKGKGLAPYLQKRGFHCYVLDLRARGESRPDLKKDHHFNQYDMLNADFPAVLEFIKKRHEGDNISLVTHSWGGVLAHSFLLKSPLWISSIHKMVHISTKRRVSVKNWHRFFYIDLMWNLVGRLIVLFKGYLPKGFYGPDGESKGTLRDSQDWVYSKVWIDRQHGLDYNYLARQHTLPPAFYLTGTHDFCLGHIEDVKAFAEESGHEKEEVKLMGKSQGHSIDYDHINILTAPSAPEEIFPVIEEHLL